MERKSSMRHLSIAVDEQKKLTLKIQLAKMGAGSAENSPRANNANTSTILGSNLSTSTTFVSNNQNNKNISASGSNNIANSILLNQAIDIKIFSDKIINPSSGAIKRLKDELIKRSNAVIAEMFNVSTHVSSNAFKNYDAFAALAYKEFVNNGKYIFFLTRRIKNMNLNVLHQNCEKKKLLIFLLVF